MDGFCNFKKLIFILFNNFIGRGIFRDEVIISEMLVCFCLLWYYLQKISYEIILGINEQVN